MLQNDDISLYKSLKKKKLIVFGAGGYFRQFCKRYPELQENIECLLDNDSNETVNLYNGKSLTPLSPQSIKQYDINSYVILFCSAAKEEMKKQIDKLLKVDYEYYCYPLIITKHEKKCVYRIVEPFLKEIESYGKHEDIYDSLGVKTKREVETMILNRSISVIPRLSIVLTPRCSLRCKNCNNLMWRFEQAKDLDGDKIIRSLENLFRAVDCIPCCNVIGGEPFLSKNLTPVLEFLIGEKRVLHIEVTTNGTLLPKKNELRCLENKKVTVQVSDYGDIVNQSRFLTYLEDNQIRKNVLSDMMWISPGGIDKRYRTNMELSRQYDNCNGIICKCLWEDKLFTCPRAASLEALAYTKQQQFVRIGDDIKRLRREIEEFLLLPVYEACDFCDMGLENAQLILPAEQI